MLGVQFAIVNRWALRRLLSTGIDIEWNKKYVRYEERENCVEVYFEDGSTARGSLLVAADGSKSIIRSQRTADLLYKSVGICNIEGFLPYSAASAESLMPHFHSALPDTCVRYHTRDGPTLLIIAYKSDNDEDYLVWALSLSLPSDMIPSDNGADLKRFLIEQGRAMHPEVEALFRMTPEENLMGVRNLKVVTARTNHPLGKTTRVTLLGDAAHAMTTHAGLGMHIHQNIRIYIPIYKCVYVCMCMKA